MFKSKRTGLPLTKRQREVLHFTARGMTARQIAAELHISPKTVDCHRLVLKMELGVRTLAELIRYEIYERAAIRRKREEWLG